MRGELVEPESRDDDGSVADDHSIGLVWPEELAAATGSDMGLEFVDVGGYHRPSSEEPASRSAGPLTDEELARAVGKEALAAGAEPVPADVRNHRRSPRYAVSGRAKAIVGRATETVML